MEGRELRALGTLRHTCMGCGGSCSGVRVRLLGDDESERIPRLAAQLGVTDPLVDGALRQVDGRCVFLDDANRCRIHGRFGAEAKPRTCRQYPLVVVRTEDAERIGIDPGCYTAWQTWKDGPELPPDVFGGADAPLPPPMIAQERAFLALSSKGATVAGLLGVLCAGKATGELPPRFAERVILRLQATDVAGMAGRPEGGPMLRSGLAAIAKAAPTWQVTAPPKLELGPEQDAWAVESARRMVFLRLARHLPVQGVALLALTGAVACAWADPRPEPFGAALAAWMRALRAPMFWRSLVPDPGTLLWLATGQRPMPGPE